MIKFFRHLHSYLKHLKTTSDQAGFTLVEMLLYMGLLSIFLVTLTSIFVNIVEVRLESQATNSVEQDGRYILARLNYDLSRATTVSTPNAIGDTTTSLSLVINGSTYTYSLNNGNLQLTGPTGPVQLNSSDTKLNGLTFQKIANASVPNTKPTLKTLITLESRTVRQNGRPELRSFETTLGKR